MPLKSGSSQKTISQNIRELHKGPQYERTKREHGKETADKQAVAAAMHKAGKSKK
jgi:hypothetical protein